MKLITNSGVTFLTFDILEKYGVKHAFSTRIGGVSTGVYDSLNLGFNRGDSDENVSENFRRMANAMDVPYGKMCLSQQNHTTNVRVMREEDFGNGITKPLPYTDVDGMVTNVKGMTLVTFYADCVPLYFYDPKNEAIGLSHSGWRGTVGKIGKRTVELMQETYGSRPEDIIACVGPSICKNCYEVSADVAERFLEAFPNKSKRFTEASRENDEVNGRTDDGISDHSAIMRNSAQIVSKSIIHPEDTDKYMLDLWEACRQVFIQAGILEENIEITDYCTKCHPELFYSHRIMGAARGSLAAFLSLPE